MKLAGHPCFLFVGCKRTVGDMLKPMSETTLGKISVKAIAVKQVIRHLNDAVDSALILTLTNVETLNLWENHSPSCWQFFSST